MARVDWIADENGFRAESPILPTLPQFVLDPVAFARANPLPVESQEFLVQEEPIVALQQDASLNVEIEEPAVLELTADVELEAVESAFQVEPEIAVEVEEPQVIAIEAAVEVAAEESLPEV